MLFAIKCHSLLQLVQYAIFLTTKTFFFFLCVCWNYISLNTIYLVFKDMNMFFFLLHCMISIRLYYIRYIYIQFLRVTVPSSFRQSRSVKVFMVFFSSLTTTIKIITFLRCPKFNPAVMDHVQNRTILNKITRRIIFSAYI